jgi:dethiobiotin synthetase
MESGVVGEEGEDELALREACGERPAVPTLRFTAPLAPYLAARREGAVIESPLLVKRLGQLAEQWPLLVLELAGGWCSPFDEHLDNAEWLAALPPSLRARLALLLVAPDRLGVLHDVSAAWRAGATLGISPRAIALTAPAAGDDSSGSNAAQLRARPLTRGVPVFELPRAPVPALAHHAAMCELAAHLRSAGEP